MTMRIYEIGTVDLTNRELCNTKFGRSKFSFSKGDPVSVTDYPCTTLANIYIGISLYKSVLVGTEYPVRCP